MQGKVQAQTLTTAITDSPQYQTNQGPKKKPVSDKRTWYGVAKSDIEAKNVQTYALHQGHVLSVRKKDIGIETILISRERERKTGTHFPARVQEPEQRIWHDGPGLASFDIKIREPWVTLDVEVSFINFVIDTGATYSVLIQPSGPTCLTIKLLT